MSASQTREPTSPGLAWARAKYWLWKLVTAGGLGPICVAVIAEGLRTLVPALGLRLYKLPVPGFDHFRRYEETRRLDLAMFMAVFLLAAVWWLWEQVLRAYLSDDDDDGRLRRAGWNPAAYRRIVLTLGTVILAADSALFYASVTQLAWGGSRFSVSALLATAAYLAVIVFVSLISFILRKPLDRGRNSKDSTED